MKNQDDDAAGNCDEVAQFFHKNNIWQTPTPDETPTKWLQKWQIYKVTKAANMPDRFGLHFVGYEYRDGYGVVSSKIESFDSIKMSGTTETGRVYQLIGLPGPDMHALHTLGSWTKLWGLDVENITDEFIQQNKIDLEKIKAIDQQLLRNA